jgi:acetyl esterase/lipase
VTGAALFPDWTAQWALDYVLEHSAVLVMPDYRLLPESTGLDILEDIDDFWTWVQKDLQAYLASIGSGVEVDLDKILCYGESAGKNLPHTVGVQVHTHVYKGGYLSIQSALSQNPGLIKAIIAAYPMIDVDSPWYSQPFTKPIMGSPTLPSEIVDEHLAAMKPGQMVLNSIPPNRIPLGLASVQHGRLTGFIGTDDKLFPMRRLEKVMELPFVFVYHGKNDSAVPVEGTISFAEEVEKKFGKDNIILKLEPGDHGFDGEATLQTPWLKEGLVEVTKRWIG